MYSLKVASLCPDIIVIIIIYGSSKSFCQYCDYINYCGPTLSRSPKDQGRGWHPNNSDEEADLCQKDVPSSQDIVALQQFAGTCLWSRVIEMPKSSMSHNGTRMWDQMQKMSPNYSSRLQQRAAAALQNLLSRVLAHGASRRRTCALRAIIQSMFIVYYQV